MNETTPQSTPEDRELAEEIELAVLGEVASVQTISEQIATHTSPLRTALAEAKKENERLKQQIPCPIRAHFCACPNCEPVMCCSGQECGCQGMPIDFKTTDKCDDYCLNLVHQKLASANNQLITIKRVVRECEKALEQAACCCDAEDDKNCVMTKALTAIRELYLDKPEP